MTDTYPNPERDPDRDDDLAPTEELDREPQPDPDQVDPEDE